MAWEGNSRSGTLWEPSLCAGAGREPQRQCFGHKMPLERKEEFVGLGSWLRIQHCPLLLRDVKCFYVIYRLKVTLPPGSLFYRPKHRSLNLTLKNQLPLPNYHMADPNAMCASLRTPLLLCSSTKTSTSRTECGTKMSVKAQLSVQGPQPSVRQTSTAAISELPVTTSGWEAQTPEGDY